MFYFIPSFEEKKHESCLSDNWKEWLWFLYAPRRNDMTRAILTFKHNLIYCFVAHHALPSGKTCTSQLWCIVDWQFYLSNIFLFLERRCETFHQPPKRRVAASPVYFPFNESPTWFRAPLRLNSAVQNSGGQKSATKQRAIKQHAIKKRCDKNK